MVRPAPGGGGASDAIERSWKANSHAVGARLYVRRVDRTRRDLGMPHTPRRARARRNLAAAALASIATLACVAPAPALAAGEPKIVAAGIDATDRFVVSWTLEPGTTFDFLEFSSIAIYNPFVPGSFAGRNVIASACVAPKESCLAPPTLTAFRSGDRVARDRRYFVKVNARRGGSGPLSSEVWVIDRTKPLRPGGGRPPAEASNKPVIGEPYKPPNPKTVPAPKIALVSPPRKIESVIRNGVRVNVDCPSFACYAVVGLRLVKRVLVFSDATARPNIREAFVLRPRPARRAALRRRTKARLEVFADIIQPGGKRTRISRRFTVRR